MPGHYVNQYEPVLDLRVGLDILTLCSPEAGKIMRSREIGEVVNPGEPVLEVTTVGRPTWELFIAYRRADAPGHAGRVGERLIANFGSGQVFKDIESLPPGVDFVDYVRDMLQRAVVMVVIIGPRWLLGRRIHNPEDLHREEIRTAVKRGIHTLPVLVDGAHMPPENEFPEDIRLLARRQAVEITDTRWDYDVGQLSQAIARALSESPRRQAFLAQVPPLTMGGGWQWIEDNPTPNKKSHDEDKP